MSRRSKDQRREDYLDIGAALVAESAMSGRADAGLSLAHVKLADVADRAGVTKGALYHIWPSQESYWHDLLQHLIDNNQLFGRDMLTALGRDVGADSSDQPTLRQYGNVLFDALREDPTFFARISLFSYLHDEAVRSVLDQQFRTAVRDSLPALERSVQLLGRRVRDETALWDMAVSIAALLDGLCLQYRIAAERTPDLPIAEGQRWSLFSAAAEALLLAYTEPLGSAGDETRRTEPQAVPG